MKLYISGPMTDLPEFNYPAFNRAADALRYAGWDVENPAEHFDGVLGLPRHRYLAADVAALIERCNAICLLSGWAHSDGARLEAQIALDRDYRLYQWVEGCGLAVMPRIVVEAVLA